MKTLLLLRHAKSSWDDVRLPDHDRPLKKRGLRDAPRMGEILRDRGLIPDLVVSSTALRAHKTAQLAAAAAGVIEPIRLEPAIYEAEPEAILSALRPLADRWSRVLVVGHNPGLEDLIERMSGERHLMPTAALAVLELEIGRWAEIGSTIARVVGVWRPRELED